MKEALKDCSFEDLPSPWEYENSTNARRTDAAAHIGQWCGRVSRNGLVPGGPFSQGQIRQLVELAPGQQHAVSLWVNGASRGGTRFAVLIDRGDGSYISQVSVTTASGWLFVDAGVFTAVGASGGIRLATQGTSGENGFWYVDDVSLLAPESAVAVRKWDAYSRLKTVLQGINGSSPYRSNLGSRVYTRLVTPEDLRVAHAGPWCCIPVEDDNEQPVTHERGLVVVAWNVNIYAYVPETNSDAQDTATGQAACDLRDDIYRAILGDMRLNGAVSDLEFRGVRTVSGIDPDMGHAEILFSLALEHKFQASDLGV